MQKCLDFVKELYISMHILRAIIAQLNTNGAQDPYSAVQSLHIISSILGYRVTENIIFVYSLCCGSPNFPSDEILAEKYEVKLFVFVIFPKFQKNPLIFSLDVQLTSKNETVRCLLAI